MWQQATAYAIIKEFVKHKIKINVKKKKKKEQGLTTDYKIIVKKCM